MNDRLGEELRALGRALADEPYDPAGTAEAVLARIAGEPVPVPGRGLRARRWLRRRRRLLAALLAGVLIGLVLTPPVRAGVAGWFDFGGVKARVGPTPLPPTYSATATVPPPACGTLTVAEARRRVDFVPLVPAGLGTPESAGVSADGAVLSLCWRDARGARIRVDQFPQALDPGFFKTVRQPWEEVRVGGAWSLWFADVHRLDLTFADGATSTVRPAGPTLVWMTDTLTLRLEGLSEKGEAVRLAERFRP